MPSCSFLLSKLRIDRPTLGQHAHLQLLRETAMHILSLPYPDDLLIASGKSPKALEAELAFLLAAKLFELRRLSLGKAAALCQMPKLKFMYELGQLQIPVINLDDDSVSHCR
jgi:predicted HTH domain antitoxin